MWLVSEVGRLEQGRWSAGGDQKPCFKYVQPQVLTNHLISKRKWPASLEHSKNK